MPDPIAGKRTLMEEFERLQQQGALALDFGPGEMARALPFLTGAASSALTFNESNLPRELQGMGILQRALTGGSREVDRWERNLPGAGPLMKETRLAGEVARKKLGTNPWAELVLGVVLPGFGGKRKAITSADELAGELAKSKAGRFSTTGQELGMQSSGINRMRGGGAADDVLAELVNNGIVSDTQFVRARLSRDAMTYGDQVARITESSASSSRKKEMLTQLAAEQDQLGREITERVTEDVLSDDLIDMLRSGEAPELATPVGRDPRRGAFTGEDIERAYPRERPPAKLVDYEEELARMRSEAGVSGPEGRSAFNEPLDYESLSLSGTRRVQVGPQGTWQNMDRDMTVRYLSDILAQATAGRNRARQMNTVDDIMSALRADAISPEDVMEIARNSVGGSGGQVGAEMMGILEQRIAETLTTGVPRGGRRLSDAADDISRSRGAEAAAARLDRFTRMLRDTPYRTQREVMRELASSVSSGRMTVDDATDIIDATDVMEALGDTLHNEADALIRRAGERFRREGPARRRRTRDTEEME